MTKHFEKRMHFEISADELLEIMTDPAYIELAEKAQGALEVTIKELSRTDQAMVNEVKAKVYSRGLTGIDKSKTEINQTTNEWDLTARKSKWTLSTTHSERVRVWGAVRIDESGEHADLIPEVNVEVKIPLLGGKIEKYVGKEIEKSWPRYEQTIRDFIKTR
ncbi:MAG: DUF2505 family protein [Deltaproteobacteria bacterium]|nr:DUF2505 family protein [Deltaproteobacteria bacterium]